MNVRVHSQKFIRNYIPKTKTGKSKAPNTKNFPTKDNHERRRANKKIYIYKNIY